MGKDLNRYLSKEDVQMANEHMEGCSTSVAIRKMQVKTTVRYHFSPSGMASMKNQNEQKPKTEQ